MIFWSSIYIERNAQILSVLFDANWVLWNPHPCQNIKHNHTPESFASRLLFAMCSHENHSQTPTWLDKDAFWFVFFQSLLSSEQTD